MLFQLIACVLVFFTVTLGPRVALRRPARAQSGRETPHDGRVVARRNLSCGRHRLRVRPAERTDWILLGAAVAGMAFRARTFATMVRDADVRRLLVGQLLVMAWCLGWQALVVSYGGGGWAGDWYEHWERALFFLRHWPLDHLFLAAYPLTARPPLANVVTAALLELTRVDFAHYQMITTLLSSLVYLPAALLARRFSDQRAVAVTTLLLMCSPFVVQNATFPWTKLPAAFFILAALYFFCGRTTDASPGAAAPLCGALLAAGLLAHYSAGPLRRRARGRMARVGLGAPPQSRVVARDDRRGVGGCTGIGHLVRLVDRGVWRARHGPDEQQHHHGPSRPRTDSS